MTQFDGESGGDSGGDVANTDMGNDLASSDMGGEGDQDLGQPTDMQGSAGDSDQAAASGDGDQESEDQEGIDPEGDSEPTSEPGESEEEEEETEEEQEEAEEERKPLNYEFANSTYSFEGTDEELHGEYPEGVKFDAEGYPDFSPYAVEAVEIDMKGNHTTDYQDANSAAGLERTPEGYTWHHHQDGKTMLLVPTDLHSAVRHTGGVSTIRHGQS